MAEIIQLYLEYAKFTSVISAFITSIYFCDPLLTFMWWVVLVSVAESHSRFRIIRKLEKRRIIKKIYKPITLNKSK